jgi:hypothetical protein
MIPLKTAATTTTTTSPLRQQKNQEQQKTRQGVISAGMNALDHHIERLEAKLSFLIRSYDDSPTNSLYQYEKKIAIVKKEINEVMEMRRCQIS